MNHPEIPTTRKNTKISFRTDEETLKKLKAICRLEGKTTSSLIENILMEHMLGQESPALLQGEKRHSPRKQCSIPAVISKKSDGKSWKCIIINLSTSSMQIILKNPPIENLIDSNLHVIFALPNNDDPFFFSGCFVRINYILGECVGILNFECTEEDHEILKKYLADKAHAHTSNKK